MPYDSYKFELKPLPYSYDALEPYIDAQTVEIHHNKHLKTYVDNLNKALENHPNLWNWPLEKLIIYNFFLPFNIQTAVRHNAGGVYNHNFYFDIMTPSAEKKTIGSLKNAIDKEFNSFDMFKERLKKAGLERFGSGYAWLIKDSFNKLKIISTPNQDVPLILGSIPILLVDVWEHAYYLKYQNRRGDYLENWFNLINWEKCEQKFQQPSTGSLFLDL